MNWERLARTETHPLRVSILEALASTAAQLSPKALSAALEAPLSTVNYHVTELGNSELVKLVEKVQVRGATEHFYRAVDALREAPSRAKRRRKTTR